jgi:hypothetical protein
MLDHRHHKSDKGYVAYANIVSERNCVRNFLVIIILGMIVASIVGALVGVTAGSIDVALQTTQTLVSFLAMIESALLQLSFRSLAKENL